MASKTVLITGSSTGIGRAAAIHFQKQGWNVAATMRTPNREKELQKLPGVICPALDVTDPNSIASALAETMERFGSIDAIVNNAGYGLTGPFEGVSEEQVRRQFETNVFGLMRMTKAILPHFRERKAGVILNVSSMGGRVVFPFYSIYHATKWAVEGFTESLRFEVEPLGIRLKIIEPGAIKTDFYDRSGDSTLSASPKAYQKWTDIGFKNMNAVGAKGAPPEAVARVIFRAATDNSSRLRYPVGSDAKSLLFIRKLMTDGMFAAVVNSQVFKGIAK